MGKIARDLSLDDALGADHVEAALRTQDVPPMPPQAAAALAGNETAKKAAAASVNKPAAEPSTTPSSEGEPSTTQPLEPVVEPSVTLSVRFTRSAYGALREESIRQTLARSQGRVSQSEVVNDLVTLGLAILAADDRNAAGAAAHEFYDARFGKPSKQQMEK